MAVPRRMSCGDVSTVTYAVVVPAVPCRGPPHGLQRRGPRCPLKELLSLAQPADAAEHMGQVQGPRPSASAGHTSQRRPALTARGPSVGLLRIRGPLAWTMGGRPLQF